MTWLWVSLAFVGGNLTLGSLWLWLALRRRGRHPRMYKCRNRSDCHAWAKVTCGSGYCAEHCRRECSGACVDPSICRKCFHPLMEHAPLKCLFASTTYEPVLDGRMKPTRE